MDNFRAVWAPTDMAANEAWLAVRSKLRDGKTCGSPTDSEIAQALLLRRRSSGVLGEVLSQLRTERENLPLL
jgi:hypothetical protein